jgi:predicted nucleotide-binding protein
MLAELIIQKLIERADELSKKKLGPEDYENFLHLVGKQMTDVFGAQSSDLSHVMRVAQIPLEASYLDEDQAEQLRLSRQAEAIVRMKDRLRGVSEALTLNTNIGKFVRPVTLPTQKSRKVFVVHGHNQKYREELCRVLEKLNLDPIVLHEQPDQGRTIIEKFEVHSDVMFAVVLLTADDVGRANAATDSMPRARQNVILELGYFLGKLGRDRVCALYENGVEIPSDYAGVLYKHLDNAGKWKYDLGKELTAAGLTVDLNQL